MMFPRATVLGPVLVTERSASSTGHCTVVEMVWLWLLLRFGSVTEEEMEASFCTTPLQVYVAGTLNTSTKLLLWLSVRVRLSQRTMLLLRTQPAVELFGSKVSPAGTGSSTTTLVAVSGPLFRAVSV